MDCSLQSTANMLKRANCNAYLVPEIEQNEKRKIYTQRQGKFLRTVPKLGLLEPILQCCQAWGGTIGVGPSVLTVSSYKVKVIVRINK